MASRDDLLVAGRVPWDIAERCSADQLYWWRSLSAAERTAYYDEAVRSHRRVQLPRNRHGLPSSDCAVGPGGCLYLAIRRAHAESPQRMRRMF